MARVKAPTPASPGAADAAPVAPQHEPTHLRVWTHGRPSFWRAGHCFTPEPRDIPLSALSPGAFDAITGERLLAHLLLAPE